MDKVVVFIDNSDLYRALHSLGISSKLDYRLLREQLVNDRIAPLLRFYCGELFGDSGSRRSFYQVLRNVGFEIFAGQRYGTRNAVNAALDEPLQRWIHCQIVYDMATLLEWGNFDTFILVSGAPEYAGVIHQIKRRGIDVEVVFFEESCSRDLKEAATSYRDIDLKKCLMNDFHKTECEYSDSKSNKCLPNF